MTFIDLLIEEVQELYDGEKQLHKALPEFGNCASEGALIKAISSHLKETEIQIERIEHIFDYVEVKPKNMHNGVINGLIDNCNNLIDPSASSMLQDFALLIYLQKIGQYIISRYESSYTYSSTLNNHTVTELLYQSLEEEIKMGWLYNDLDRNGEHNNDIINIELANTSYLSQSSFTLK